MDAFGELANLFRGDIHDKDVQAAVVVEMREPSSASGLYM